MTDRCVAYDQSVASHERFGRCPDVSSHRISASAGARTIVASHWRFGRCPDVQGIPVLRFEPQALRAGIATQARALSATLRWPASFRLLRKIRHLDQREPPPTVREVLNPCAGGVLPA